MVRYVEQLEKIEKELKEIKKEIRISSFDTIYTSVIILGASIIVGFILANKLNFWVISLGIGLGLSIIFQFISIFIKTFKQISIWLLCFVSLYLLIVYSYVLVPGDYIPTFNLRSIISAIIFVILFLWVIIITNRYFNKE